VGGLCGSDPTLLRLADGGQNIGILSSARQQAPRRIRGQMMSWRSPKDVIVANRVTERFAQQCESMSVGRGYRSVPTLRLRSGVTLRDFIEREGEGS